MKKFYYQTLFILIGLFFVSINLHAQLGFCNGSSGDPIFTETFGTGTTDGPELPSGTTAYNFTTGIPADGDYTISSTTDYFSWIDVQDHTPGDNNGKSFIVNASFSAGEFYQRTINGLCENTTYEFSSWLINLIKPTDCSGNSIPVNVRFQIWDETDTTVLAQGDTGDIPAIANPNWEQYGLVFKTEPGQTAIILKMINWSNGGCGNDLAIDDIVLKTCGDTVTVATSANEDEVIVCGNNNTISRTLIATPDNIIFNSHAYQWQQSTDQQNWTDIVGETTSVLNTPAVTTTTYYRAKIAEDAANLTNNSCNVVSNTLNLIILPTPSPPVSNGDIEICEEETGLLQASTGSAYTINWYDAPTGGNLLQENSNTYETTVNGTYYAEAVSQEASCTSTTRTPINLKVNLKPISTNNTLYFCQNNTITLSVSLAGGTYLWSTGETTREIEVGEAGTYTVDATNASGCSTVSTVILEPTETPIIDTIKSDGPSIIVSTKNNGDFEYSLDNITYQDNVFETLEGGAYTIYARDKAGCGTVRQDFFHLVVPKFFSPNGDNVNNIFSLEGLEIFNNVEFSIFDRYGKLLKYGNKNSASWDGQFRGTPMPEDDYWYIVKTDTNIFKGHFSLKR